MGAILSLVHPVISLETVEALSLLLSQAQAGQITGLAYVALHKGHEYSADSVGRCQDLPALTRGMLCDLSEEIGIAGRK